MTNEDKHLKSVKELEEAFKDYLQESRDAAQEWQDKARKTWNMIQGFMSWAHKKKGQSRIHINRVGLALNQIKAQIKQGLMNFDDWMNVESFDGFESELLYSEEAKRLVIRGISDTDPKAKITDNAGVGAVENLFATKLQPKFVERRRGGSKKELHIEHVILNIRNFYPDPTGSELYEIHEFESDKYKLLALSDDKPSLSKPYIKKKVTSLPASKGRLEETEENLDKGNQHNIKKANRRNIIVIHEVWGTVLAEDGTIMKFTKSDGEEIELKNVVFTIANEDCLIQEPIPFPTIDNESCFIKMQIVRSNINLYGNSLLFHGAELNRLENELISAINDAGLSESFDVKVIKEEGLADPTQVSNGIKPGMTLKQNGNLAPGEQLLSSVETGRVSTGSLRVLDLVQSSAAENMNMNQMSLTGNLAQKQVRASELTASQQTVQGLFESFVADIEDMYVEKYATKVFHMMLQYKEFLTTEDLMYVFSGNMERALRFKDASAKECFKELGHCFRFRGRGIRTAATNQRRSQMIIQIFSVLVANPLMMDAFERRGLDATKFLEDVLKGEGLDFRKYLNPEVADFAKQRQLIREESIAQAELQGQNTAQQGQGPDVGSETTNMEAVPGSGSGINS